MSLCELKPFDDPLMRILFTDLDLPAVMRMPRITYSQFAAFVPPGRDRIRINGLPKPGNQLKRLELWINIQKCNLLSARVVGE